MKSLFGILLCASGLLLAQPAADPAATARKAVDLLIAGSYNDLFRMFSPELQKDIPEPELAKLGAQVKSWGAVQKIGDAQVRQGGSRSVAMIPAAFASQNVYFQIAIDADGKVAALLLRPGEQAWQRPSYVKPDAFREQEVTVGDDEWKLPGTMSIPNGSGPFPAVVLVQRFGPGDRDETIGGNKVFRDLAEGLASRGIVVLRYEKRTRQYRARLLGRQKYTPEEETVEDAVRAAALLRVRKEVDPKRVYVLGHGLGGYLAPRIAERDGKLAGIIILAGQARPLEDVIVSQLQASGLTGARLEALKAQADRIKKLEESDSDLPNMLGLPVPYWLDLKGYDPIAIAKKLPARMLILQGGRDFETSSQDMELWKSGLASRKDVTVRTYPSLNHLFVAGEGKSTEAEYRKPGHVAPEVIDDIAKFITG